MTKEIQDLTSENIQALRYIKRFGYILGVLIWFAGLIADIILAIEYSENMTLYKMLAINIGILLLGVIVIFLVNRKYDKDIISGQKTVEIEQLQSKSEAVTFKGQKNKTCEGYHFIINGYAYPVTQTLYNQVEIGDNVLLHYAPNSQYLLEITTFST